MIDQFKSKCIETNFKIISNNRVNVQLLLLLSKIRSIIRAKDSGILTLDINNKNGELSFEFIVNGHEFDSAFRIDDNDFQI